MLDILLFIYVLNTPVSKPIIRSDNGKNYLRIQMERELQAGRSRFRFPTMSLKFFIDIILPATLWPWGRISLKQKRVPGIFHGVKAAGA